MQIKAADDKQSGVLTLVIGQWGYFLVAALFTTMLALEEGKRIRWTDGIGAVLTLLRCRVAPLSSFVVRPDPASSGAPAPEGAAAAPLER